MLLPLSLFLFFKFSTCFGFGAIDIAEIHLQSDKIDKRFKAVKSDFGPSLTSTLECNFHYTSDSFCTLPNKVLDSASKSNSSVGCRLILISRGECPFEGTLTLAYFH